MNKVYALDLARDLGFPGMTAAFWRWCRDHGLEPVDGLAFAFRPEDVQRALRRAGKA